MTARHATAAVPALIRAAAGADAEVRIEALGALQVLNDARYADELIGLLLRSAPGPEREAAERAVRACCLKIPDVQQRAGPLLRALEGADLPARCVLLPALGRVGGDRALQRIRAARSDPNKPVRNAAVRALCNWPDAAVADELLSTARSDREHSHRIWALRGYVRVVAIPGQFPPQEAFERLAGAMKLADRPDERRLILTRLAAVRTAGSLALCSCYTADPELASPAIEATLKLAEALRRSHPDAARAALKKVLNSADDEAVRERTNALLQTIR